MVTVDSPVMCMMVLQLLRLAELLAATAALPAAARPHLAAPAPVARLAYTLAQRGDRAAVAVCTRSWSVRTIQPRLLLVSMVDTHWLRCPLTW